MADAVAGIMDGVRAILVGTATDRGRSVASGTFRAVETVPERVGAMAASGAARPFVLEPLTVIEGPQQPANVSGTHVYGSHILRLVVLYATRRQETYELLKTIQADEYQIRRALLWPLHWSDVTGWVGAEILGTGYELLGPSDPPDLLGLVVEFRVDHREDWG